VSVTAILCTRDRPALLEGALAALVPELRHEDRCLVVDSASRDAASIAAVTRDAGVELVRADRPGLSRARNVGVAASSSPIVAFTDDDCRPMNGWAAGIAAAFEGVADLGFVTGTVTADREAKLPIAVSGDRTARRFTAGDDPTTCGHGANMAFRRDALVAIGGFDEHLGAGGPLRAAEDSDAFHRLLCAGWTGAFDPSIAVSHVQWRTTAEALKISYGYGLGVGAMGVKAVRRHRRGGWAVLGRGVWKRGLAGAARDLRNGYQTGALSSTVRAGGVLVGSVRGALLRLEGERFS
jgi:glycosyltransferase involved in cell wall biosynthesis